MNIKITDERIEQTVPVALENVKCEILEAKSQTFQTLDEKGDVVEQTLNVIQPSQTITLKDLEMQISDTEIALTNAQTSVENLTAELQNKRALKTELEKVVQPVYDANMVAVEAKAKEVPVEEKLPTEEPIIP